MYTISKFVDGTNLGSKATTETERLQLEADLNKIKNFISKWQMGFDIDKCKVFNNGSRKKSKNSIKVH